MQLTDAIQVALVAHEGQRRDKFPDSPDYGMPYMVHPMRVAMKLIPDLDAAVVGMLHDVLEDCKNAHMYHNGGSYILGFRTTMEKPCVQLSIVQATALRVLTRKEGEDYTLYIRQIINTSELAVRVKHADVSDNLASLPKEGVDDRRERYEHTLELLRPLPF